MEELIDHLHVHSQVWETTNPVKADPIEISEVWESIGPASKPIIEQTQVEASKLEQWLKTTRSGPRKPSLRIVWVKIARNDNVHYMSESQIKTVVDAFKLDLAYKYFGTSGADATEISRNHDPRIPSQYAFSYRPNMAAIWTREVESHTIQAMIFTVEDYIKPLKLLLERSWRMLDQEMFIPFLCSVLIGLQVDESSNKVNKEIRGIENRTGVHGWKRHDRKMALSGLESLLQEVGAMSTRTASSLRKIKIITRLNHFALERLDSSVSKEALTDDHCQANDNSGKKRTAEDEGGGSEDYTGRHNEWFNPRIESHGRLRNVILLLDDRAHEQHIRVEYLQQRVQLQTQVIESVIDHLDTLTALAQTEVSNRIATSSHQDTFSMKSLATVSMAFLPATFVAACFDMPLFNWDSSELSGIVSLRILIFPLVAGVITGFVSLIYWRLMESQKKERVKDAEHSPWRMEDDKEKTVIANVVGTRQ